MIQPLKIFGVDKLLSTPVFVCSNRVMGKFLSRRVGKNSDTRVHANILQPVAWGFRSLRKPLGLPGKLDSNPRRRRRVHTGPVDWSGSV
jgi:hypothetical protein